MNPLITIACLLGLAASPLWAETGTASITGRVSDADSGDALPYATVLLIRDKRNDPVYRATATDLHGRYTFSELSPGAYRIEAAFIGYHAAAAELSLGKGQTARSDVHLKPDPILLKPETPLKRIPPRETVRRLAERAQVGFLHTHDEGCRDYTFAGHATQEARERHPDRVVGWMEYVLTGCYLQPDVHKQQVHAYRSRGEWRFSMSPGVIESPASGMVGGRRFKIAAVPITTEGMDSYRYESVSTVQMGDIQVSHIAVIPKNGKKPGLAGDLWIALNDFSLVGYDLRLNAPALRRFRQIERWHAYQQNALFYDRYWLPVLQIWEISSPTHTCKTAINLYDYRLNLGLTPALLRGPDVQILPDAGSRDSAFWAAQAAGQDTVGMRYRKHLSQGRIPMAWRRAQEK